MRDLETEGQSSLTVIASRVAAGSTVLDVGCGSGSLGRRLTESQGCKVDGLTFNPDESDLATPHYRRVELLDLEQANLLEVLGSNRYDTIVCADILEHLRQPERLLAQLPALLQKGGKVLISVPNASYAGIVNELLQGEFRYRPEGLLDATHVRMFTRRSLIRMLREQGWRPYWIATIERELCYSEFEPSLGQLPPAVRTHLLARPDALTYQFVVEAEPVTNDNAAPAPDLDSGNLARPYFTTAIGLLVDDDYTELTRVFSQGLIGEERQVVRFPLPRLPAPARRLRFEPSHRPGILHLHALRLVRHVDTVVWRWDGRLETLASCHRVRLEFGESQPADSPLALLLTGDDGSFELPIPNSILAEAFDGNHRIAVELDWPLSPDYLRLARTSTNSLRAARSELEACRRTHDELKAKFDQILSGRAFRLALHLSRLRQFLAPRRDKR